MSFSICGGHVQAIAQLSDPLVVHGGKQAYILSWKQLQIPGNMETLDGAREQCKQSDAHEHAREIGVHVNPGANGAYQVKNKPLKLSLTVTVMVVSQSVDSCTISVLP